MAEAAVAQEAVDQALAPVSEAPEARAEAEASTRHLGLLLLLLGTRAVVARARAANAWWWRLGRTPIRETHSARTLRSPS